MSFVATHPARAYQPTLKRIDPPAVATWVLGFGLVLYLGIKGGGMAWLAAQVLVATVIIAQGRVNAIRSRRVRS